LIDVRTTAEYYWVGACGKVESILTTSDREFIPYEGKVTLKGGDTLVFKVASRRHLRWMRLPIKKVKSIVSADISIHIPTHIWDEAGCTKFANPDFAAQIESLSADYDSIILMCRSGKRSNTRAFDTSLFSAIYEIDQPDGTDGYGGFQGTSYSDVYNGYRGYPGRKTRHQSTKSASWSDAGLPIHTGWTPFSVSLPEAGELPQ
jgi:rhodanese-related sulfurtransferase